MASEASFMPIGLGNVPANIIAILARHDFRVWVFVGERQTKALV